MSCTGHSPFIQGVVTRQPWSFVPADHVFSALERWKVSVSKLFAEQAFTEPMFRGRLRLLYGCCEKCAEDAALANPFWDFLSGNMEGCHCESCFSGHYWTA
jgi:hypothetical protein